jgi:hypothetical protein
LLAIIAWLMKGRVPGAELVEDSPHGSYWQIPADSLDKVEKQKPGPMKIHVLKRRPEVKTDKVREKRISTEILVDAYDSAERAMGWYYYLDQLNWLCREVGEGD